MPRYVAFLRAVNVGGHGVVKMEVLRAAFEQMTFRRVESFLASGNIVFESPAIATGVLAGRIESQLSKALGREASVFVRTDAEVAAIAAQRRFAAAAIQAAPLFSVALLAEPPGEAARQALGALASEENDFYISGSEIYWLGRLKQSETKMNAALLERRLGMRMTVRGMSTMQKLAARYPHSGIR